MTDTERLDAMRVRVESIFAESDLQANQWKADFLWGRQVYVGEWHRSGGQTRWSITASKPEDSDRMGHFPATLQFTGQVTPRALRVLTEINSLMWDDREV